MSWFATKRQREARQVLKIFFEGEGREALTEYCAACGAFRPTYVADDEGGRKTAFNEGRRAAALDLLALIGVEYDDMLRLKEEHDARRTADRHVNL